MSHIDPNLLAQAAALRDQIRGQISKVFIGVPATVDLLLTAVLAPGHVLLEGVPGVAKTTLAKAFSETLGCDFRRIQFTPDLLPADITGTYVISPQDRSLVLRKGPIFAHVVLGDEINRAPAKTQSALLEAMQEQQVTLEGDTLPLPDPFLVLATQNPLEQEGVYPLPEAQVDRFLMKIEMGYPSAEHERRMLLTYNQPRGVPTAILDPVRLLQLRALADQVHVSEALMDYVVALATATRRHDRVRLGVSPRASLALMRATKAQALLEGRDYVRPDDVRALAPFVWAHRVVLSPEAELDDYTGHDIVQEALTAVRYRGPADPRPPQLEA
ncbi:MAG: AAA family ATPase [Bradymonadia bacterium]